MKVVHGTTFEDNGPLIYQSTSIFTLQDKVSSLYIHRYTDQGTCYNVALLRFHGTLVVALRSLQNKSNEQTNF